MVGPKWPLAGINLHLYNLVPRLTVLYIRLYRFPIDRLYSLCYNLYIMEQTTGRDFGARFSYWVDRLPVELTRHGKIVAVVIASEAQARHREMVGPKSASKPTIESLVAAGKAQVAHGTNDRGTGIESERNLDVLTRARFETKSIESRNKIIRGWGFDPESQGDVEAIEAKIAELP